MRIADTLKMIIRKPSLHMVCRKYTIFGSNGAAAFYEHIVRILMKIHFRTGKGFVLLLSMDIPRSNEMVLAFSYNLGCLHLQISLGRCNTARSRDVIFLVHDNRLRCHTHSIFDRNDVARHRSLLRL